MRKLDLISFTHAQFTHRPFHSLVGGAKDNTVLLWHLHPLSFACGCTHSHSPQKHTTNRCWCKALTSLNAEDRGHRPESQPVSKADVTAPFFPYCVPQFLSPSPSCPILLFSSPHCLVSFCFPLLTSLCSASMLSRLKRQEEQDEHSDPQRTAGVRKSSEGTAGLGAEGTV